MRMGENRNECKRYTDEIKSHKFPWKYSNNFKYLCGKSESERRLQARKKRRNNSNNNSRQMRRRWETIECRPMEICRERARERGMNWLNFFILWYSAFLLDFFLPLLLQIFISVQFNSTRFVVSFEHLATISHSSHSKCIFAPRIHPFIHSLARFAHTM